MGMYLRVKCQVRQCICDIIECKDFNAKMQALIYRIVDGVVQNETWKQTSGKIYFTCEKNINKAKSEDFISKLHCSAANGY